MLVRLEKTLHDTRADTGASAVEYALLVIAIALVMVIGAFLLGGALSARFDDSSDCVAGSSVATC